MIVGEAVKSHLLDAPSSRVAPTQLGFVLIFYSENSHEATTFLACQAAMPYIFTCVQNSWNVYADGKTLDTKGFASIGTGSRAQAFEAF